MTFFSIFDLVENFPNSGHLHIVILLAWNVLGLSHRWAFLSFIQAEEFPFHRVLPSSLIHTPLPSSSLLPISYVIISVLFSIYSRSVCLLPVSPRDGGTFESKDHIIVVHLGFSESELKSWHTIDVR